MTSERKDPQRFFFRPPENYFDMSQEERYRWLEQLREEITEGDQNEDAHTDREPDQ